MLDQNQVEVGYLAAAVCFILALKGLSSPKSARRGNLIGAAGAAVALVTAFLSAKLDHLPLILLAIVLATVNLVGGFVVTDRMLEMFKGRQRAGEGR